MVAEEHAAPRAASDKHVPCYGDKIGRCILFEECQIRSAKMTCHIIGRNLFSSEMRPGLLLNFTSAITYWQKRAKILDE